MYQGIGCLGYIHHKNGNKKIIKVWGNENHFLLDSVVRPHVSQFALTDKIIALHNKL